MAKNGSGRNGMEGDLGLYRQKERGFWSLYLPKPQKEGDQGSKIRPEKPLTAIFLARIFDPGPPRVSQIALAFGAINLTLPSSASLTATEFFGRNNPNYHPRLRLSLDARRPLVGSLLSALSRGPPRLGTPAYVAIAKARFGQGKALASPRPAKLRLAPALSSIGPKKAPIEAKSRFLPFFALFWQKMAKNGSGRNGMEGDLGPYRQKERGFWSLYLPKTQKEGDGGQKFGQKNRSQQFFWHEFLTHGLLGDYQ